MKSMTSGFSRTVLVILIVVVALIGVFLVVSSFNADDQINSTQDTIQTDVDAPLETASSDIADDIEQELDALAEDDYSDSGLSDSTLYE